MSRESGLPVEQFPSVDVRVSVMNRCHFGFSLLSLDGLRPASPGHDLRPTRCLEIPALDQGLSQLPPGVEHCLAQSVLRGAELPVHVALRRRLNRDGLEDRPLPLGEPAGTGSPHGAKQVVCLCLFLRGQSAVHR